MSDCFTNVTTGLLQMSSTAGVESPKTAEPYFLFPLILPILFIILSSCITSFHSQSESAAMSVTSHVKRANLALLQQLTTHQNVTQRTWHSFSVYDYWATFNSFRNLIECVCLFIDTRNRRRYIWKWHLFMKSVYIFRCQYLF